MFLTKCINKKDDVVVNIDKKLFKHVLLVFSLPVIVYENIKDLDPRLDISFGASVPLKC